MTDSTELKFSPIKAKPGLRYLATGFDYFFIMSIGNTIYALSHHNGMIKYIWIGVWLIYFPIIEGIFGQTLGKVLFKFKVVKNDYSDINILNSIARRLFDVIDFLPMFGILGLIIASSNKTSKRIGDMVAKTIVVQL